MLAQRDLRGPAAAFELEKVEEKLKGPLDADERTILEERCIVLRERIKRFSTVPPHSEDGDKGRLQR